MDTGYEDVEDKDATLGAGVGADETEAKMQQGAEAKEMDLDQHIKWAQEENVALQRDTFTVRDSKSNAWKKKVKGLVGVLQFVAIFMSPLLIFFQSAMSLVLCLYILLY